MTSEEAMNDAWNSMSSDDLKKFKMTRKEWIETVNHLEEVGIYPDNDPRNKTTGV